MGGYASILPALLAGGGLALLSAHGRANRLNQFDAQQNQRLTSAGAQPLNFPHRNFYFGSGDAALHQGLVDDALKQYASQQQLNDYNTQGARYGLPAFGDEKSASAILSPYNSQNAQMAVAGQYGQPALQGALALKGIFSQPPQGQPPQGMPSSPSSAYTQGVPVGSTPGGTPLMDDTPSQPPLLGLGGNLQAGASQIQMPQLPPGAYVTPDMVKTAGAQAISQQGADAATRNAETTANRLEFDKGKWKDEAPTRAAKLIQLNQAIRQSGIKNPLAIQLLRAQIGAANRSNRGGGAGRGPTAQEQFEQKIAAAVQSGAISPEEAKVARRISLGLSPKASAEMKTTTYNPDGTVKSTSVRERAGTSSSTPGGKATFNTFMNAAGG